MRAPRTTSAGWSRVSIWRGSTSSGRRTIRTRFRRVRFACTLIGAGHRYAHYIRKTRGVDFVERYDADPARLHSPRDVRALLTEGIVVTEETVEPLLKASEQEIQALSFAVRWGPQYDPEMILEHAVCHALRHRRQLERW